MFGSRMLGRSRVAALVSLLVVVAYSAGSGAQTAPTSPADQDARMRILQQRIDDLSKQLKTIQEEQTKTDKTVATVEFQAPVESSVPTASVR